MIVQGYRLVLYHTYQEIDCRFALLNRNASLLATRLLMTAGKSSTFSIASLNTLGIPLLSPYPVDRYIALCQAFERLRIDIINLQEVHTYNLFHLLKKNLPSYPQAD